MGAAVTVNACAGWDVVVPARRTVPTTTAVAAPTASPTVFVGGASDPVDAPTTPVTAAAAASPVDLAVSPA
jgi:hypothetical protein